MSRSCSSRMLLKQVLERLYNRAVHHVEMASAALAHDKVGPICTGRLPFFAAQIENLIWVCCCLRTTFNTGSKGIHEQLKTPSNQQHKARQCYNAYMPDANATQSGLSMHYHYFYLVNLVHPLAGASFAHTHTSIPVLHHLCVLRHACAQAGEAGAVPVGRWK